MQDCQRAKDYLAELPLGVVFGVYFAFKKNSQASLSVFEWIPAFSAPTPK